MDGDRHGDSQGPQPRWRSMIRSRIQTVLQSADARLGAWQIEIQRLGVRLPSWAPRAGGSALVAITAALLLRALLTPATPAPVSATPGPPDPTVGHYAPDVTLLDASGNRLKLSSLRGKVIVLNFWYASCPGCQIEMPALQRAYQQNRGAGLVVVGLDVADDATTMTDFARQIGITYPVFLDDRGQAYSAYRLSVTPVSFVIDRAGVIRATIVGPADTGVLRRDTSALLAAT